MSRIARRPITTVQLGVAASTLFTVPASNDVMITLSIANDTTTACYFTLYKVPDGGTAGVGNLIVNQRNIGSKGNDHCSELQGLVFGPGETLQGLAETASQLTVTGGYVQILRSS
jgi:hypothetical protein